MRLQELTITNFGIYKNENHFNFPYSPEKKVSVIIGKNGSGKTTFLNAIKICLFGSMILKNRTITKNYESLIMNTLNKDALKDSNSHFSIEANFISQVHNYDGKFTILREWEPFDGFKEKIVMKRNDKVLSAEEQSSFLNALYHAFPLDLFDLFYLDGEKIDQLSVLNSNILNLLESSINIDLFKKLKSDLINYASKRTNNKEIDILIENKSDLENEKSNTEDIIEKNRKLKEELYLKSNTTADEIKNLKESLHIDITAIDSNEIKEIEEEIIVMKRDIENDLIEYLPFTLVENQLDLLLSNIINENKLGKNLVIKSALSSSDLKKYLLENGVPNNKIDIVDIISSYFSTSSKELIHNLSDDHFYSLKNKILTLQKFDRNILLDKMKKLNSLESKYTLLTKEANQLELIKSSGQLDLLLSLQSAYDDFKNSIIQIDELIILKEVELENIDSSITAINNQIWKELKKNNVSKVLDKIHTVLNKYVLEIKNNKIKEIEHHTKYMFDRLIRKNGFINNFKIEDQGIYLMDDNENKLNHSNLSAGEKQLFVLSLLYAVIQSSDRHVPLMFDTLLGRLDEEHRDNVFKEFISSCPDQVIILATDSELANIDKGYLKSITNTEYTIDFSKIENKMSEVRA